MISLRSPYIAFPCSAEDGGTRDRAPKHRFAFSLLNGQDVAVLLACPQDATRVADMRNLCVGDCLIQNGRRLLKKTDHLVLCGFDFSLLRGGCGFCTTLLCFAELPG